MIDLDLRTYLLTQTAVTAIVSTRVYPVRLPQGTTLPAVTYQRVAGASEFDHEGSAGLGRGRWQFDCWALSYAAMVALAESVRAALATYGARIVNVIDMPEPEITIWRRLVELYLWHQED